MYNSLIELNTLTYSLPNKRLYESTYNLLPSVTFCYDSYQVLDILDLFRHSGELMAFFKLKRCGLLNAGQCG